VLWKRKVTRVTQQFLRIRAGFTQTYAPMPQSYAEKGDQLIEKNMAKIQAAVIIGRR